MLYYWGNALHCLKLFLLGAIKEKAVATTDNINYSTAAKENNNSVPVSACITATTAAAIETSVTWSKDNKIKTVLFEV